MLVIFIADLSLLIGFFVLLTPILITEVSRPRDWFWGALFLFVGLLLLVNVDRLEGSLLVLLIVASFLMLKLVFEVAQNRWMQLSSKEILQFTSFKRWMTSFKQTSQILLKLFESSAQLWKNTTSKPKISKPKKKWVRQEPNKDKDFVTKSSIQINDSSKENEVLHSETEKVELDQ